MDVVFNDNQGHADQERMRQIVAEVGLEQRYDDVSTNSLADAKQGEKAPTKEEVEQV